MSPAACADQGCFLPQGLCLRPSPTLLLCPLRGVAPHSPSPRTPTHPSRPALLPPPLESLSCCPGLPKSPGHASPTDGLGACTARESGARQGRATSGSWCVPSVAQPTARRRAGSVHPCRKHLEVGTASSAWSSPALGPRRPLCPSLVAPARWGWAGGRSPRLLAGQVEGIGRGGDPRLWESPGRMQHWRETSAPNIGGPFPTWRWGRLEGAKGVGWGWRERPDRGRSPWAWSPGASLGLWVCRPQWACWGGRVWGGVPPHSVLGQSQWAGSWGSLLGDPSLQPWGRRPLAPRMPCPPLPNLCAHSTPLTQCSPCALPAPGSTPDHRRSVFSRTLRHPPPPTTVLASDNRPPAPGERQRMSSIRSPRTPGSLGKALDAPLPSTGRPPPAPPGLGDPPWPFGAAICRQSPEFPGRSCGDKLEICQRSYQWKATSALPATNNGRPFSLSPLPFSCRQQLPVLYFLTQLALSSC